ncbi:MAG: DUF5706 domain-containing protein, partial [Paracoccus sp. (in: a-proteobacteria)]|nr:DUF5706 domain-containing protein [Paracoccus sp. (in: a-proteobacteria)]
MTRKTRRDAAAEAFHAVLAQSENRDAEDATTHGETPKDGGGKKKKPSKSKAEAACDETAPLGSAKAVDTLFRNAIRAELDIINLAAMKANIMISLNGLIISALMISGAFIFASSQVFILPAGVFMLTAAASIFFALLAASPDRIDALRGIWRWLGAVVQRRARLRDWRSFADDARQATAGEGDLNLLIYEDRVRLDPREYWERMQTMLRNRDEVYYRMSDQLYWLGKMADRKFRLLDMSYRAFRWGLLASVVVFLSVKSLFGMFPALSGQVAAPMGNLGIAEFSDIYEPSAVQQLPDGRILVVEDEATRAFSI